jgi:hypothetical protein
MHVRLFPPTRFAPGVAPFARVFGLILSLVTLHGAPILDLRTNESPGPSSRRTSLAFTEIQYHPIEEARDGDPGAAYEFVELYNSNPYFEDISGWKLDGAVEFVFPPGTRIEGLKRLVVAANPEKLRTRHGITNVVGPWVKKLGNDGDTLRLVKGSGGVVLEVSYSDESPWPVAADGAGHTLVMVRPSYGENHPWAWAASAAIGGSPGEPDPAPTGAFERVLIDEIFANSTSPALDFIEVRNHGPTLVDLSGCWLSDDPLTNKFRIPESTRLEAGRRVAFDEMQLGFSLKAGGERVYLRQPDGSRVVDAVAYGPQAPGLSWGRPPAGEGALRELERPTPGDTNAPRLQRPVIINELFYHPPYGMEENEFVELHNRGGVAVDLGGWSLGRGVDYTFDAGGDPPSGWLSGGGTKSRPSSGESSGARPGIGRGKLRRCIVGFGRAGELAHAGDGGDGRSGESSTHDECGASRGERGGLQGWGIVGKMGGWRWQQFGTDRCARGQFIGIELGGQR